MDLGCGITVNACTSLGSGLIPYWEIVSPKKGMLVHLKRYLSLLSFKFTSLHILSILSNVTSWSLPSSSKPSVGMLLAKLNSLGIPLSSSSVFSWNMSLAGATPNNNHIYLYLPNG